MSGTLSEYELLRLRNIKRNHEFMKSLGLPVPAIPAGLPSRPRKTPAKKRKTLSVDRESESSSESSDDSDEDWVPGSEEVRKRKKMIKRFLPEFRPKPQTVPVLKGRKEPSKLVENEENDSSAFDELGRLGEELDFNLVEKESISGKQGAKSGKKKSTEQRTQYATRGKKHSYCEAEVPDDDHYIFCEECQDLHYGDCPVHGPLQIIEDRTQEGNSNLSSAVASLPTVLERSNSSIPGAGLGVFSTAEIPKGVRFGPYKGKKIGWQHITDKTNTSYMWEIVKDGKFSHFVDGRDENESNWMRFVNCSRCEDEQNLVAYQFRGEIYYRTYKPVNPGKELLVWYGESYAKDLGISLFDDQANERKGNAYTCEGCKRMYTSINFLQRHKKRCSSRNLNWEC
ncbi:histone-lysine N-methyltransferase PRDM9-like [Oculina patagonica]